MPRFFNLLKLSFIGVLVTSAANSEQVAVHQAEYSNDTITDGGRLLACIVTLAVIAPQTHAS